MTKKPMVFTSTTDEIKHLIIELLSSDGEEHTRCELLQYARDNALNPEEVSSNKFTGALRSAADAGMAKQVKRGLYIAGMGCTEKPRLEEQMNNIMQNCIERLKKACNINILGITEDEIRTAERVKQFILVLEHEMAAGSTVETEKTGKMKKSKNQTLKKTEGAQDGK